MLVTAVYCAVATWLLIGASHNPDSEAVTAGWLIFGAPWTWSGVLGRYYWLALPLNALTLYLLVVLVVAAYRKVFRGA